VTLAFLQSSGTSPVLQDLSKMMSIERSGSVPTRAGEEAAASAGLENGCRAAVARRLLVCP